MVNASHGTHVASIAAGNRGLCRDATLAGVLISLPNEDIDRRKSFYDSTRIAHAVDYLMNLADELGTSGQPLPISINISLGTNGHAHDASSAVSRWIDYALAQPGRSVSVAAGNAGQHVSAEPGDLGFIMGRIHSSGRIPSANLKRNLEWVVLGDGIADLSENELEIWWSWNLLVSASGTAPTWVRAEVPGNRPEVVLPPAAPLEVRVPELMESGAAGSLSLASGAGTLFFQVDPAGEIRTRWTVHAGLQTLADVPAGSWVVRVDGAQGGTWTGVVETDGRSPARVILE
jgi:hypothetical protein